MKPSNPSPAPEAFDPLALLLAGPALTEAEREARIDAADAAFQAAMTRQAARQACKCKRCGGLGRIPGYQHIDGGRCFRCGGSGLAK